MNTAAKSYTAFNYQRSNGFPGNKTYTIYQDRRDYIWIGTENGLVSFNGYAFRTYTTQDGLPDNEVLGISEDSSGKLWLTTFSHEICYLWRGRIHHPGNDTLLRKLKFSALPGNVCYDRWGNTWIAEQGTGAFLRIDPKKEITRISSINGKTYKGVCPLVIDGNGDLVVLYGETSFYRFNKDHFELLLTLPQHPAFHYSHSAFVGIIAEEFSWTPLKTFVRQYLSGKDPYWEGKDLTTVKLFSKVSDHLIAVSAGDGLYLKEIYTGRTVAYFLKGCATSRCLMARDSSLWITTLGNGVFHISPSFIQSVPDDAAPAEVLFIHARQQELYYVAAPNTLVRFRFNAGRQPIPAGRQAIDPRHAGEPCHYISRNRNNNWVGCISDSIMYYAKAGEKRLPPYNTGFCKSVLEEDERFVLIGTIRGIYRLDKDQFTIDALYDKRVTALAELDRTVYAGTVAGMIAVGPDKKIRTPFRSEPALNGHITALCATADSILWIANNKGTLFATYRDRIIKVIDGRTSLGCNNIAVLKGSADFLWVGTDNGLYALNRHTPYNVVRHLSYASGLKSDQINCLAMSDGRVWVGTDKGLNYFDEKEIVPVSARPSFIIDRIQNDAQDILPASGVLRLRNKTLKIDFDVIDHSGTARPIYAYRLDQGNWTEIGNSSLYFPTTPYGPFTVSIRAISANWTAPQVLTLSFYRTYPYYLSWWFLLLIALAVPALAALLIYFFVRRARKKDRKELAVQQQLLALEQMALQGQMNPHFIFNCIAAIRQYYNKGDVQRADRFVDAFSGLIRTTFEMAAQTFTSLERELGYLNLYLLVEQERFSHSFTFSIVTDLETPPASIPVPVMLLQPFVENAVQHGVRHLPDGTGRIVISVAQRQDRVEITITDNGIGRARTQAMKQAASVAVPITSTHVNRKRIDILNRLFGDRISMRTEDVTDHEKQVAGTLIFISYPLDIYVFR